MVKNRQKLGVPAIEFVPPAGTPNGVEVMSLTQLRDRVSPRWLVAPRRPEFHHLLTLTGGSLQQSVDFTTYTLTPGSWLWVRPGQVQQWGDITAADGTLILFENDFLDASTASAASLGDPYAAALIEPDHHDSWMLREAADHLCHAFHSSHQRPLEVQQDILRHLLAAFVLSLVYLEAGNELEDRPTDTFRRFRDAVERNFTRTRRVTEYSLALGYSPRTLSRATDAAVGINAKRFIDRRTVLEAKRLLAHSNLTAAQIANQLGFTSATNFSKFFHQNAGTTPGIFRDQIRALPVITENS